MCIGFIYIILIKYDDGGFDIKTINCRRLLIFIIFYQYNC